MPHPYLGPLTPRTSRSTHSTRTSSSTSALTRLPLRMKVCVATSAPPVGLLGVMPRRAALAPAPALGGSLGRREHAGLREAVARRLRDRRDVREGREVERRVVVDGERGRRPAGGAGVGARRRGHRRRDTELAAAAGRVGGG